MLLDPMYAALISVVLMLAFVVICKAIGDSLARWFDLRRRLRQPVTIVVYNLVTVSASSTGRFSRPLTPHKDAIRALEHQLRYRGRTQPSPTGKDLN